MVPCIRFVIQIPGINGYFHFFLYCGVFELLFSFCLILSMICIMLFISSGVQTSVCQSTVNSQSSVSLASAEQSDLTVNEEVKCFKRKDMNAVWLLVGGVDIRLALLEIDRESQIFHILLKHSYYKYGNFCRT